MSNTQSDLIMEVGTPVIIIGFTKEAEDPILNPNNALPHIYAGRLAEPHRWYDESHRTFIIDGPLAGSISPNGIVDKTFSVDARDAAIVILNRKEPDDRGCCTYLVVEDVRGIVGKIERQPPWEWESQQAVAANLYAEAMEALQGFFGGIAPPFTSS